MTSNPSVETRREPVLSSVQDDYRQMVRRFDLLWESPATEHGQQEMQRLITLIESYEDALKVRALSTPQTVSMEQDRHGCSTQEVHLKENHHEQSTSPSHSRRHA